MEHPVVLCYVNGQLEPGKYENKTLDGFLGPLLLACVRFEPRQIETTNVSTLSKVVSRETIWLGLVQLVKEEADFLQ